MNVELTREQAHELNSVLDLSLREMSHEIAATDNAQYRAELAARRHLLVEVAETVRSLLAGATTPSGAVPQPPPTIVRDLARPGD